MAWHINEIKIHKLNSNMSLNQITLQQECTGNEKPRGDFVRERVNIPGDAGRIQKDAKPGKTREPGKKDQNYI